VRPEDDVAVYPVIVEPPVAPAVNGTDTTPEEPPEAVPIVGACGTVEGVTEEDALEAEDVPLAFVAVTVYVRAVPTASAMVIGLDEPVAVLPEEEVTVYEVIVAPPVAFVVKGTDTFAFAPYA
jgi:hypothetical protein